LNTGQRIIFAIGLSLNLILGGFGVFSGALTPGDLVMLQALMVQIFAPLNNLGNMYREWVDSYYEIRELFKILDQKPKILDSPNAREYEFKGGQIEFRKVSFGYFSERPIIKDVTLTIPALSCVSIVGESGVGKSSLLNIIFRMYDPDKGNVFLDGQNLKDLKLESFREKIAIVSQSSILFNDTILNNLLYANPLKSQEEIHEVCRKLNLHDKIMQLPKGYDTLVGEQGSKFSGGERQRFAIARCLLKDSPIILLDEITTALDALNENRVIEMINNMKKKKTIIMVTHKLHMNEFCDQVLMVRRDGAMDMGPHEELLKNSSSYKELWKNYQEKKNEIDEIDKIQL
jgi:ABC-type multidrug transport system fused ATPase/permease subunit